MPTHTALPARFSFPVSGSSALPASSSAFDYSPYLPSEYDWSRQTSNSMMEFDIDDQERPILTSSTAPITRKLEFVDVDSQAVKGMDISFDASPSDSGKIRVRIHPSDSASSQPATKLEEPSSSLAMWAGQSTSPTFESSTLGSAHAPSYTASTTDSIMKDQDQLGPFLGVGSSYVAGASYNHQSPSVDFAQLPLGPPFSFESQFSPKAAERTKRRVRVALKTMPTATGEGGEWEIELC